MGEWLQELADARANKLLNEHAPPPHTVAVSKALRIRREVEAFQRRWPEPQVQDGMAPTFSWAQLERQLADLADTPLKQAMARDLVSATRKMARFKPPEMILREILCLSWALLDESFQPQAEEGSAGMT